MHSKQYHTVHVKVVHVKTIISAKLIIGTSFVYVTCGHWHIRQDAAVGYFLFRTSSPSWGMCSINAATRFFHRQINLLIHHCNLALVLLVLSVNQLYWENGTNQFPPPLSMVCVSEHLLLLLLILKLAQWSPVHLIETPSPLLSVTLNWWSIGTGTNGLLLAWRQLF